mmetsp:Transcript_21415/g.38876  ORF Transcript_21415/g.38876 Transcript_21415/m.38876 type:complete len:89 (+) Transcript_21415:547-813(+)
MLFVAKTKYRDEENTLVPIFTFCKSLEEMAHRGQIVVSSDMWNVASHLSQSKLGSPQLLDLDNYVVLSGESKKDGLVCNAAYPFPAGL